MAVPVVRREPGPGTPDLETFETRDDGAGSWNPAAWMSDADSQPGARSRVDLGVDEGSDDVDLFSDDLIDRSTAAAVSSWFQET